MKPETSSKENPVGLYHDPESGAFIGALEPVQADAFVRNGFKLYKEGVEAANLTAKEIEQLTKKQES